MSENGEKGVQPGALAGIRIIDLSRILAGPTCTQILGDLGADVIKIEKPGAGDDTRRWGPPFVTAEDGTPTTESAYYLAANRNKRSVCLDIADEEGRRQLLELVADSDVLVENFKHGTTARYGLAYEDLARVNPRLVYCSITGFGQTGPYAARPGYDLLAQAMGGIMSLTGEVDGLPMKVGVGIADVTTGLYATIGILAALRHCAETGRGQHIDVALMDTQVSWLINEATNYFVSGRRPVRRGNDHPNIVPYGVYPTSDGYIAVAVGNDSQFARFAQVVGAEDLAADPQFATNAGRVENREAFEERLRPYMTAATTSEWLGELEAVGIPCGPVNDVEEVFSDPHVLHRGMKIEMPYEHSGAGYVTLLGSPLKLSDSPVTYRLPPPVLGEHSEDVLGASAAMSILPGKERAS
ncbi:CaiB/BaiF CoA-transferase family protein [Saccharopolyspora shandongensis]|uniref:CaiB/BaiF CoA transferase family protein n=1 Tax=Saccharopolyspora shandongensis TaxID=418495 RepID=UPI003449FFEA